MLPLDDEHMVAFVPSFSQVAVLDRAAQALLGRLPLGDRAAESLPSTTCWNWSGSG